MLTREQKEKLRDLSYSQLFFKEQNGTPIDSISHQPVSIPDTLELRHYAFQKIYELGFKSIHVQHTPTWKANLILRLFYKRHQPYDCTEMHNLYGYCCYTRSGLFWVTNSGRSNVQLSPKKFIHRVWFYQDEYVDYDCDFFDFYLKIE